MTSRAAYKTSRGAAGAASTRGLSPNASVLLTSGTSLKRLSSATTNRTLSTGDLPVQRVGRIDSCTLLCFAHFLVCTIIHFSH